MFTRGSFVFRLIGVLLLVGLIFGGGMLAYRAGVAQGIVQAPEFAEALSNAAENGQGLPNFAYGHSYGHGYPFQGMRPHFGFFPFGGIFGIIFFTFMFFGLMKMIFFRRWAGHHGYMHGDKHWKEYGPPWARESKEDEGDADAENKEEK